MRALLDALGFLTRLGPSRSLSPAEAGASLTAFPLAGLVLGAILAAIPAFGPFSGHPAVQAWLVVLASVWLTRGLHLDGVADLSDAVGPALDPERFWTILKDSRTGAFGVLGLLLAVGGQWAACAGLIQARAYGALAFAPVLGRASGVVLGLMNRDLLKPGLGNFFLAAAPGRTLALVLGQTLVLGLFLTPLKGLLAAAALAALGLFWLARLARRAGGMNGDFLGAAMVWGELATLLGALAAA
jgi:adenosylcobinamide-GDP ribazoletransferase